MKKNRTVVAITMAINSSVLFSAMPQAHAEDLVALNIQPESAGATSHRITTVSNEASGKELLARGLARLTTAKQPQDFRTAYHFFEIAAHKGNAEAQFQLAIMQLDNEYTRKDDATAIHWLEEAVLQGHEQAAIALDVVTGYGSDMGC